VGVLQATALSRINHAVRIAARLFVTAGFLLLGYAAYVSIDAQAYQMRAHSELEAARHQTPGSASPASDPEPTDGATLGQIRIPRLGLSAMIVEGDSPPNLRRAVGHLPETARPGEPGNVVLAGHRDTFFRPLERIREGDSILVRTRTADYNYRVDSIAIVGPEAVEVIATTAARTLTLITCFPFAYVGAAPQRFIVRAHDTGVVHHVVSLAAMPVPH
jgi:sortase A